MKKIFSFFCILSFLAISSSAFANRFAVYAPSGHTLFFELYPTGSGSGAWLTYQSTDPLYGGYNNPGPSGDVIIPSTVTYNGYTYTVKGIGSHAFDGCNELTSVSIPNTISSIGEHAFHGCSALLSINIPNTVTSIGAYAFSGCTNLPSVVIPNSVTTIPQGLFSGCTSLSSVTIPSSITSIGNSAFYHCYNLTSVTIPNSVSTIGTWAFSHCGMISVTVHANITYVDYGAFENIPTVYYYGVALDCPWGALSKNGYIEDSLVYTSPSKDTLVGASRQITMANIPNTVNFIGPSAFEYCSNLTSVNIPNGVETIGNYTFRDCSSLISITIPESVTSIHRTSFWGCSGITTVFFYADSCSLDACNDGIFGETNLSTITFSSNVRSIDNHLFYACNNISMVRVRWTSNVPYYEYPLDNTNNVFYGVPLSNATLVVPVGTIALYTSTDTSPHNRPWSLFGTIIEDSSLSITVSSCDINKGTVMGGGTFGIGDADTLTATSNYGYHFVRWSNNVTDNPYIIVCTQDSALVAIFEPNDYTLTCNNALGGGTYPYLSEVQIHALPQANLQFRGWSDSIMSNPRMITLVSDTTFTAVFTPADTTYIHDTTIIRDSVYVDVFVHDTTYIDVPYAVHDTTYIDVHDTTYVDVLYPVHDTTYIDVPYAVHDTTYIDVHDTTYITMIDTVTNTVTVYDTITNTVFDTITNTLYDTTVVFNTDTLWLHDTVFVHDTIYIHDTVVVGVDEVDVVNAKIYTNNGQIVVDGAESNTVWLYDVNGRVLATKQDAYSSLRFDVPASGAYMVRIGNHPARKVVVIR